MFLTQLQEEGQPYQHSQSSNHSLIKPNKTNQEGGPTTSPTLTIYSRQRWNSINSKTKAKRQQELAGQAIKWRLRGRIIIQPIRKWMKQIWKSTTLLKVSSKGIPAWKIGTTAKTNRSSMQRSQRKSGRRTTTSQPNKMENRAGPKTAQRVSKWYRRTSQVASHHSKAASKTCERNLTEQILIRLLKYKCNL